MGFKPRHGMTNTKVWRAWRGMRERCLNPTHPAYKNYGARGITMNLTTLTDSELLDLVGDIYDATEGLYIVYGNYTAACTDMVTGHMTIVDKDTLLQHQAFCEEAFAELFDRNIECAVLEEQP